MKFGEQSGLNKRLKTYLLRILSSNLPFYRSNISIYKKIRIVSEENMHQGEQELVEGKIDIHDGL